MRVPLFPLVAVAITLGACNEKPEPEPMLTGLPCSGGAGGALTLTDRADAAYSVSFTGDTTGNDSLRLEVVVVGRGAPGWRDRLRERGAVRPVLPDSESMTSGAGIGQLYMGYDRRRNVAWVHDQRVPLDSFNIIFVDRIDSVGGPPIVTRKLRFSPSVAFAPGTCAERANPAGMRWADSIRAVLLRSPDVRAFAGF